MPIFQALCIEPLFLISLEKKLREFMKTTLGLIFLIILSSCLEKRSVINKPSKTTNSIVEDSPLTKLAKKSKITCLESSCPSNIGIVAIRFNRGFNKCNFIELSNSSALLSTHCLDENSIMTQTCPEDMAFLLPSGVVKNCHGILSIKGKIVEIKTSPRSQSQVMKIPTATKIENGDQITIWKNDFTPGSFDSEMRSVKCEAQLGSLLKVFSKSILSQELSAFDCSTKEGNSGAPVFNKKGQLIGIIESKVDSDNIGNLYQDLVKENSNDDYLQLTTFSNVGCFQNICDPKNVLEENLLNKIKNINFLNSFLSDPSNKMTLLRLIKYELGKMTVSIYMQESFVNTAGKTEYGDSYICETDTIINKYGQIKTIKINYCDKRKS